MTLDGDIPAGARARLLYRDNLAWIVEPASPLDAFPLKEVPAPGAAEDAHEHEAEEELELSSRV